MNIGNTDYPSEDREAQNTPPPDPVAPDMCEQSSKKDHEGKFDGPETAVE